MPATDHALSITRIAAQAAADKLGTDIVAYDVSERLALTDVFLIVTASNERQVSSVVDGVEEALFKEGVKVKRREGDREARWVLLDFGDLVLHAQHTDERHLYSLDRLWRDCPAIPLQLDVAPAREAVGE
ncbi:ribosome silencing factor [Propioniciclava tarda]|uniref:Ribosomal silencing factor RsfS n=1 Tax=Propioniciclava tarda TaxID=433330 RepID=A0A4Q9KMJ3_PROTD|nr:ribosome silencing factor [Propioniciclava tarda]TBT95787.1 ribosome silencing factor [Propioniciclava tarda]SMO39509.1 ribosome-associated protein [Propioniciclava tarda]HOA89931.1 ribosome silencing factor [Propioniciclava tarda]HQA32069.1 ribosome silencing factor [Propioniciclava tarda]HQD61729.1 ribosome silencing factor [Propioniciclava tarda]